MENSSARNSLFDSSNVLVFIYKWRKRLIVVGLIAAVVSGLVSFLIEPRFKSTVIMIPTTTVSISRTLLKEWDDVLKFGEEREAEQMLQILNSDGIRDRIAEKYNLYKHYKISENSPYKRMYLKLEYDDRIWFSKTPFNAVEIDVIDRSPDTAAFIANDIAALIDSTKNKLQKERAKEAFQIVESSFVKKKELVSKLEDSLRSYTEQGIFDYEIQSGILFKQYAKAMAKNNSNGMQQLDAKLKLVGKKGWEYVALRDFAYHERNEMFALNVKFDQAKLDMERSLPSKYIINPAIPAEKRTSPVRWLIVLVSTISAVLLALVTIIAMDKLNNMGTK